MSAPLTLLSFSPGLAADSWDDPDPSNDDLDLTAGWHCVAHKASLAAVDVFSPAEGSAKPDIKAMLEPVRQLIRYIRASAAASTRLAELQLARLRAEGAATPQAKALQLDVATRWLSTHEMLAVFVQLYKDILRLACLGYLDEYEGRVPRLDEARLLRNIVAVLEPVAQFVRDCEGEKDYVPIALAPVLYKKCLRSCADTSADSPSIRTLKADIRFALDQRLGYLVTRPNLALAAAALHPAYGHLGFVDAVVRNEIWATLALWASEFSAVSAPAVPRAPGPRLPGGRHMGPEAFAEDLAQARQIFEEDRPQDELLLRPQYDPFIWWKDSGLTRLYPLVRLVFSVPATSAPSERAFSALAATVTKHRSGLLDYKREMLTVIRTHLKNTTPQDFIAFCLASIQAAAGKKRPAPSEAPQS